MSPQPEPQRGPVPPSAPAQPPAGPALPARDPAAQPGTQPAQLPATIAHIVSAAEGRSSAASTDPAAARTWQTRIADWEKLAQGGDANAMAALHYAYANGLGGPPDPKKAFEWAQKAADTGNANGKHVLARCYLAGIGCDKNPMKGEELIKEAAEGSPPSPLSQTAQAMSLLRRPMEGRSLDDIKSDVGKAMRMLEAASAAGVPSADVELGRLHHDGMRRGNDVIVPIDRNKTLECFKRGESRGSTHAMVQLALLYTSPDPRDPISDQTKARGLLEKAAGLGNADAQFMMACEHSQRELNIRGRFGFTDNAQKAFQWASLSAGQNQSEALLLLSTMYANGTGTAVDNVKAKDLCDRSVAAGNVAALYQRANRRFAGTAGYTLDTAEAMKDWAKASDLGHVGAMSALGKAYEQGHGVKKDDPAKTTYMHLALEYYAKAAQRGDEFARGRIEKFQRDAQRGSFQSDDVAMYQNDNPIRPVDVMKLFHDKNPTAARQFAETYRLTALLPKN